MKPKIRAYSEKHTKLNWYYWVIGMGPLSGDLGSWVEWQNKKIEFIKYLKSLN